MRVPKRYSNNPNSSCTNCKSLLQSDFSFAEQETHSPNKDTSVSHAFFTEGWRESLLQTE